MSFRGRDSVDGVSNGITRRKREVSRERGDMKDRGANQLLFIVQFLG